MEKGFYHESVGYWQGNSEPSEEALASHPEGTIEVPLKPSYLHTFDGTNWIAPTQEKLDEVEAASVRYTRNLLLENEVDSLVNNPLRWAALSDAAQTAWTTYRTALLDITEQAGFPHNVTWPTKPEG